MDAAKPFDWWDLDCLPTFRLTPDGLGGGSVYFREGEGEGEGGGLKGLRNGGVEWGKGLGRMIIRCGFFIYCIPGAKIPFSSPQRGINQQSRKFVFSHSK